jgi:hypothetical protein
VLRFKTRQYCQWLTVYGGVLDQNFEFFIDDACIHSKWGISMLEPG